MNPEDILSAKRRTFIKGGGYALGSVALSGLLNQDLRADLSTGMRSGFHHPPRAKRIIHLCMAGGPSHLETFDPKPALKAIHGKPFPTSFTQGQQLAQLQNTPLIARGSFTEFQKHGHSGIEISNLFPAIASHADELCVIRSMHIEQINHDPAHAFMNAGSIIKGRPSMGSWLLYGLGSDSENLPGYVVMVSISKVGPDQPISARQWSSGFLPSRYQGIQLQTKGAAVHYINNPQGISSASQRSTIDQINALNQMSFRSRQDPEIQTRIAQYEMAFKMQSSVPELTDILSESEATLKLYGIKEPNDGSFASNCLLARRLAERGVRFIQLYHRGWDHHQGIEERMPVAAREVDQATAGLLQDLKQRGMLEDTLVIWGGEFGRTPMGQGSGRDHHINAFSIFMAGAGIRGGTTWGETDELGYHVIPNEQSMHVHDLHATMLHLCGIDHQRLTHRYQGRDFRLTDVHGKVAHGIFS